MRPSRPAPSHSSHAHDTRQQAPGRPAGKQEIDCWTTALWGDQLEGYSGWCHPGLVLLASWHLPGTARGPGRASAPGRSGSGGGLGQAILVPRLATGGRARPASHRQSESRRDRHNQAALGPGPGRGAATAGGRRAALRLAAPETLTVTGTAQANLAAAARPDPTSAARPQAGARPRRLGPISVRLSRSRQRRPLADSESAASLSLQTVTIHSFIFIPSNSCQSVTHSYELFAAKLWSLESRPAPGPIQVSESAVPRSLPPRIENPRKI